ncbi:hypothetical protein CJI97_002176 [Candidozyma auris]|nr:hypothetical protein CJI97_002176 [[Candida] auris]
MKKDLHCKYQTLHKPGLPSGYGAAMLEKIKNIDHQVTSRSDLVLQDLRAISTTLRSLESKVSSALAHPSVSNSPKDLTQNSHECQTQTSGVWMNHGHEVNNEYATDQRAKAPQNGGHIESMVEGLGKLDHRHETPVPAVPSVPVFTNLIDMFYKNIYPGFRVIHPSLRSSLIEEYSLSFANDRGAEIPPHLLGIVLVSVPFMRDTISQRQIDSFQAHCRSKILTSCISITSIERLQAMALLTFDSFGRSNDPLTWSYIALISGAVIHLGLTKEPSDSEKCVISPEGSTDGPAPKKPKIITPQSISLIQKTVMPFNEECHRNLFWEIFLLDRLSSVSNSFPCKIDEAEIDRQLPLREDLWRKSMKWEGGRKLNDPSTNIPTSSLNENHDSAAYLVEIVAKLGRIHTFLREPFDISDIKQVLAWQMKFSELSAEVQSWKSQLPKNYQTFLETQNISFDRTLTVKDILLFSIYHMTIIRLNSAVGYQNFDSDYILFSSMARSKCLESAQSIAAYSMTIPTSFAYTEDGPFAICGPYYGFTVWVAARLLLVNAIRLEEDFSSDLDQLISALSHVGFVWRSSAKYKEVIELLKKEESEYRANGRSVFSFGHSLNSDGINGGSQLSLHPESARLFSDMRFNAYSLGVILSKKIEQLKKDGISFSPHNQTDFSNFFQWFQIPIHELNGVSANHFTDIYSS